MIIQFIEERGPDILTWISVSAAPGTCILRRLLHSRNNDAMLFFLNFGYFINIRSGQTM